MYLWVTPHLPNESLQERCNLSEQSQAGQRCLGEGYGEVKELKERDNVSGSEVRYPHIQLNPHLLLSPSPLTMCVSRGARCPGRWITLPPPLSTPSDCFFSGLIYTLPFMRPMKCGCVTRPAFRFGRGAVKGTLCWEGPLSAAVDRAVPRPVETSKAEHSAMSSRSVWPWGPALVCVRVAGASLSSLSPSQVLPGGLAAASQQPIYRGGRLGPN